MKKALFVVAIIALSVVNYFKTTANVTDSLNEEFNLSQVEAIAGCEVSSDPAQNKGYCVPNFGSEGDSCVQKSDSDAVRCSKNI